MFCLRACMCITYVPGATESRREHLMPQELELQLVVALGSECGFSAKTEIALNSWAISPGPDFSSFWCYMLCYIGFPHLFSFFSVEIWNWKLERNLYYKKMILSVSIFPLPLIEKIKGFMSNQIWLHTLGLLLIIYSTLVFQLKKICIIIPAV